MSDDKPLEASRARLRLLEQTITELRAQLSVQSASSKTLRERVGDLERESAGARPPRRQSTRAPAVRAEPSVAAAEAQRELAARQHDLAERTKERDEARIAANQREREVESLRSERDEARTRLHALEHEREAARAHATLLESQLEMLRAMKPAAPARVEPQRPEDAAEIEAAKLRIEALERQLEELRAAWKASDERANGLEGKLKHARSETGIAIVRAAAERAEEVARLLEKAIEALGAGELRRR